MKVTALAVRLEELQQQQKRLETELFNVSCELAELALEIKNYQKLGVK